MIATLIPCSRRAVFSKLNSLTCFLAPLLPTPRIAADIDELARARRAGDLDTAAVLPDRRAERRRRLAEPDLEFRAFCTRRRLPASSAPQLERAWDAWQAERYQRGETDNPFRPR